MGAIAAILKVATPSTANATSYASGSYTPAANRLLVAGVQASRGSSTNPPTPTLAGNGLTWALAQDPVTLALADNLFQASGTLRDRLCVFRALTGATPSAGAVTATYGATCTGCTIIVAEIDLADLTAPVVQMRMVAVGAAAATVTMDAFEDADNAVISFFAVDANATIVGEHPELADITYATPAREHMAQFLNVADTSPSATWTGANTAGGIAIELRQAAGGPVTVAATAALALGVTTAPVVKVDRATTPAVALGVTTAPVPRVASAPVAALALGLTPAPAVVVNKATSSATALAVTTAPVPLVVVPVTPALALAIAPTATAVVAGDTTVPVSAALALALTSQPTVLVTKPTGPAVALGATSTPALLVSRAVTAALALGATAAPSVVVVVPLTPSIALAVAPAATAVTDAGTIVPVTSALARALTTSPAVLTRVFPTPAIALAVAPTATGIAGFLVVPATLTVEDAEQVEVLTTVLAGAVVSVLDATGILVVVADQAEVALSTRTLTGASVSVVDSEP